MCACVRACVCVRVHVCVHANVCKRVTLVVGAISETNAVPMVLVTLQHAVFYYNIVSILYIKGKQLKSYKSVHFHTCLQALLTYLCSSAYFGICIEQAKRGKRRAFRKGGREKER